MHTAWSQFDLTLAVGGYARYIRLWDAERELKKADLATGSDSYVSSLRCSNYYAASSAASGIFTAGFGDGSVKLFDIRSGSLTILFEKVCRTMKGCAKSFAMKCFVFL